MGAFFQLETFQILCLTNQTCPLTHARVYYGPLYQMQQIGLEEHLLLAYFNQLAS